MLATKCRESQKPKIKTKQEKDVIKRIIVVGKTKEKSGGGVNNSFGASVNTCFRIDINSNHYKFK